MGRPAEATDLRRLHGWCTALDGWRRCGRDGYVTCRLPGLGHPTSKYSPGRGRSSVGRRMAPLTLEHPRGGGPVVHVQRHDPQRRERFRGLRKPVSTSPAQAPVTIATVTSPVAPAAAPAHIAVTAAAAPVAGYGCAAALSYLREHAAPGFELLCPGDAHGHQAMTCVNTAPQCPGRLIIAINTPCAAAYMNEASNSWVLIGIRTSRIDPYGHC